MNHSRRDPVRVGLATALSLLMLTMSVAVPVLERGSLLDHPVVEREHDPGECPSSHDHTVCTQVGANLAFESDAVESPLARGSVAVSPVRGARVLHAARAHRANSSRAPPLA